MENEEFTIEFSFKGWDYTGRVTINEGKNNYTYTVHYSLNHSPQFEKLIELLAVVTEIEGPLEWEEVANDLHLKKADKGLINAIGYTLEDREM